MSFSQRLVSNRYDDVRWGKDNTRIESVNPIAIVHTRIINGRHLNFLSVLAAAGQEYLSRLLTINA